jgi:hypothetical protein
MGQVKIFFPPVFLALRNGLSVFSRQSPAGSAFVRRVFIA